MGAIPQKKLCWNCEGNVSREIDNCPYCGVYLQGLESDDNSQWNPSYLPSPQIEGVPSPLYQRSEDPLPLSLDEPEQPNASPEGIQVALKRDVFPLLFLMSGSIFFIFGIVLWLFAQDGALTLQWRGEQSFYFLLLALPLLGLGWKFLQDAE